MLVEVTRNAHVATLTLSAPQSLNAVSIDMLSEFSRATAELEADDDVWVVVVTGAGDRAFSAGADIKTTIRAMTKDPRNDPFEAPPTIMRGQEMSKPLVAAVNGVCLGGGLEIALACDIRVASTNARFGAPEVRLGLLPGWGATQRLPRQVPFVIASEMILAGRTLTADEALRYGLVNEVVAPEALQETADSLASRMCQLAPLALRRAKQAIQAAYQAPLSEGLSVEEQLFNELALTHDAQEGIAAFEEKRPATFAGR